MGGRGRKRRRGWKGRFICRGPLGRVRTEDWNHRNLVQVKERRQGERREGGAEAENALVEARRRRGARTARRPRRGRAQNLRRRTSGYRSPQERKGSFISTSPVRLLHLPHPLPRPLHRPRRPLPPTLSSSDTPTPNNSQTPTQNPHNTASSHTLHNTASSRILHNKTPLQTLSPASGALRFRVLPLPLTDPRAFEESYDLPSPYGAVAGPWEVPLLVLRERGGIDVPEGERVGARGPLEGFWRLLFKNASAASSSSASSPTTAASATRNDASQSLSTPPKPSQAHPALLTPFEASQIDTLLPPYMPRIGPHTKVLQSVLDPFVMDLSVNDMSVVVVDALRRGMGTSSASPLLSSTSTSSSSSHTSSSLLSEQQPHKIHYTKFENMLVPLSWSHHRGPYTYNTPAHIPISKRFMTDRPALKTLLWKRRRKSPWTGQALVRFELTPPPTSKSIHAHPLLGLRILKYVVPPDPQPVWKRPKPQVVGRLVSRWKPQVSLSSSRTILLVFLWETRH
ncbi:hypothetical protein BKA70DRAFT_1532818, partial [Coprinopsis sp. MPI-PUGE-AT-0042]